MHESYKADALPEGVEKDRRRNQRREQCEWHEGRDLAITDIKETTDKQSGQWVVLMWGIGIMCGFVVLIGGMIWKTSEHTKSVVVEMDKTFTSYMVAHMQESQDGFRRIKNNESILDVHEKRIDNNDKRLDRLELFELPHKENNGGG